MEEMVKLTLSVSVPLWAAIAALAYFAALFSGIAGLGIVFISIIVVTVAWSKILTSFSESIYGSNRREKQADPYEYRLRNIESRLDEISRKLKE